MNKVHIAYDIDGTLRKNTEERHRTEVEGNEDVLQSLVFNAHAKNSVIHLWSNRGAEYCREMRKVFGLEKYVKESDCHKKLWKAMQVKLMAENQPYFKPDVAYDDQQRFDGGHVNIIVREK